MKPRKRFGTLGLFVAVFVSSSIASAQIIVVPSPAGANHPLQVTVHSVAPGTWAIVQDTSYDVSSDVVRVDATIDVGPFSFPQPYEFTITVPPIAPGVYEVRYWSTYIEGSVQTGPTLEWTTTLRVSQAVPIPSLALLGISLLVLLMSVSGWLILRQTA